MGETLLLLLLLFHLASIHHFTISRSKIFLRVSQFTYFPIKFDFIDHNFCVDSAVRLFQAPFCVYTLVIMRPPVKCLCLCVLHYYKFTGTEHRTVA